MEQSTTACDDSDARSCRNRRDGEARCCCICHIAQNTDSAVIAKIVTLIQTGDRQGMVAYYNSHVDLKPLIIVMIMLTAPDMLADMVADGVVAAESAIMTAVALVGHVPDTAIDPTLN